VQRLAIVLVALLVGGTAPARAWCEATCLAPAESSTSSHCPSHDSSSTGTSISAAAIDDCPLVTSARPAPQRLELQACDAATVIVGAPFSPSHSRTFALRHPRTLAPSHLLPLRI
jgi:hypothetical protein